MIICEVNLNASTAFKQVKHCVFINQRNLIKLRHEFRNHNRGKSILSQI